MRCFKTEKKKWPEQCLLFMLHITIRKSSKYLGTFGKHAFISKIPSLTFRTECTISKRNTLNKIQCGRFLVNQSRMRLPENCDQNQSHNENWFYFQICICCLMIRIFKINYDARVQFTMQNNSMNCTEYLMNLLYLVELTWVSPQNIVNKECTLHNHGCICIGFCWAITL